MVVDEQQMIDQIKKGNVQLFETIIKKYQLPLLNFIFKMMGDYHRSQDLAQEVFLRAWRGLDQYQYRASFAAWLFTIARNLCLDELKKPKPSLSSIQEMEEEGFNNLTAAGEFGLDPETKYERREFRDKLGQVIHSLDEQYRTVLLLRVYQDMSYEEISRVLGCPVGTVRSRLARAREMVRQQMKGYLSNQQGQVN